MFGPCFIMQYFVSFPVLQLSHYGKVTWLLYFSCVLGMWLLVFHFVRVSWVCQQLVIVAFPGHTHLRSDRLLKKLLRVKNN